MKTNLNEDNNYSLHNIENFKKMLDTNINDVVNKYNELIIEYLKFILDNIKIKNIIYLKFIIIRGLETITSVFNHLIYYTKNLHLTFFHCQKSFYYYVEFIDQISDDQNIYLQLSSKDAVTYVYKKTIYDLNYEQIKNNVSNEECENKYLKINIYVKIFKSILIKIIDCEIDSLLLINEKEKTNFIDKFKKIYTKFNNFHLTEEQLSTFYAFIMILIAIVNNNKKFLDILLIYTKKLQSNITYLNKLNNKIYLEIFYLHLEETENKFVEWLLL
jgi:hypothetical protein